MPLEQPVIRIGFVDGSLNSTFLRCGFTGLATSSAGGPGQVAGENPGDRKRVVSVADCSELTEYVALSASKVSPRLSDTGLRAWILPWVWSVE
jgi:hypothetical protein